MIKPNLVNQPAKVTSKLRGGTLSKLSLQVLLLLFLMGLSTTSWMQGGDPLDPQSGASGYIEIGLVILSVIIMFIFWGFKPALKGNKFPAFIFIVLFALWAAVTAIWSQNKVVSAGRALELLLMILLASAIAYKISKSNLSIETISFIAMLTILFFLMVISVIHFGTPLPIEAYGTRQRLTLGFDHPNSAASYFATAVIIGLALFYKIKKPIPKILLLGLSVIFFVFTYMTNSRKTLVAVLAAILILIFLGIKSKRLKTAIIAICLAGLFVVVFVLASGLFDSQVNRFIANHEDLFTLEGRLTLWKTTLTEIHQHNLFGVGYQGSRFLILGKFDYNWGYHLHNSFIETFATTGIIGIFFALGFLLFAFTSIKRANNFPLAFVYLCYMVLESMLSFKLYNTELSMFLLLVYIFYDLFITSNKSIPLSSQASTPKT